MGYAKERVGKHEIIFSRNELCSAVRRQRNRVVATNSDFLIPTSVQPKAVVANLRYFKL